MRLADDDRARVPFALLGVLLLVGASTFGATLATRGPRREDHSVETAMDRAAATAVGTLRTATTRAARDAARDPVTASADTPAGRVLNDSAPFRDALRIRVYVAARRAFAATPYRYRGVTARASLPPTPNESALRRAKRRVRVRSADDGASLRVRVRNVSLFARRDGRVVARATRTLTLTVATPVLALHDRTRTFERRLNRTPLEGGNGAGLGLRLTGRLYPVTWARGYAQYGGAPVTNVVANRHVEISTNGGVLGVQRAVYGRSDPDARGAMARATARTLVRDAPLSPDATAAADAALPKPNRPERRVAERRDTTIPRLVSSGDASGPERRMRVDANVSADRAFAHLLSGTDGPSLGAVTREGYRVDASVRTTVESVSRGDEPSPDSPGGGWELVSESESEDVTVSTDDAPAPVVPDRLHVFDTYGRRVAVEHEVLWRWRRGNHTTTTDDEWTDRYAVGVALVGEYAPAGRAPDRTTRPLYEPGGPLDGPNLADVPETARSSFDARGGADAVARRAVEGDAPSDPWPVYGRRPDALYDWVVENVTNLHERVRELAVTARAGDVAAGRANPPARLADRLRERRTTLLDAPDAYDGAATRARYEARAAYLDRVAARLDRRANRTTATNREFARTLADAANVTPGRVDRTMDHRTDAETVPRARRGGDGPGRAVTMVPDGDPAYLTRATIEGSRLRGVSGGREYYPLAARNVNLFTVPYGDATDGVLSAVFGSPRTVRLRTAARALLAANRTVRETGDENLTARRDALRAEVSQSTGVVVRRERRVLRETTSLSPAARRAVVDDATARWPDAGHRALAAANGSLAAAVTAETRDRLDDPPSTLALRLRVAAADAVRSDAAQVPQSCATAASTRTRDLLRETTKRLAVAAAENATRRAKPEWVEETYGEIPAGLPVAPVPGYWYATVNVWTVTVRGSYARFSVRSDYGGGRTGRGLTYVRDGRNVTLDVDGDGATERLGRNERVSFETGTVLAVAVPPTGTGVGDVDGDADERSAGWPCPGFVLADRANRSNACTVDRTEK